jgi:hypothetical protein
MMTPQLIQQLVDKLCDNGKYDLLTPGDKLEDGDMVLNQELNPEQMARAGNIEWRPVMSEEVGKDVTLEMQGSVRRVRPTPMVRSFRCKLRINDECNLACSYCPYKGPKATANWKAAKGLEDIPFGSYRCVVISGGETLLHPRIVDVCALVRTLLDDYEHLVHMPLYLQTNGMLLTRKKAEALQSIGVDGLGIAIHTPVSVALLTRFAAIVQYVMPVRLYFNNVHSRALAINTGESLPGINDLIAMGFSVRVYEDGKFPEDEVVYRISLLEE